MIRRTLAALAAPSASLALIVAAGCGGGSGGGTISSAPPSVLAFVVSPTASVEGTTINPIQGIQVALRDASGIPVSGSVPVTLTLTSGTLSGTVTTSTAVSSGIARFDGVSVTPTGLAYAIVATSPGLVTATSAPFAVTQPAAVDGLFQLDASGNMDFTTNDSGLSATRVADAYNVVVDPANARAFLEDYANHRVLIVKLGADGTFAGQDRVADGVIGQPTFTATIAGPSATTLTGVFGIAYDAVNHRFFAGDYDSHRVVAFDVGTGTPIGPSATAVLGQTSFTGAVSGTGRDGMTNTSGIAYEASTQRLFVADDQLDRILVFDASPAALTTGASAIAVIGQTTFTASTAGSSASELDSPENIAVDDARHRLYVCDVNNARVLVFDTTAILETGTAAIHVLGAATFTAGTAGTGPAEINSPSGVAVDPVTGRIFVVDDGNTRVVSFDAAHIVDGMAADWMVGQPDFASTAQPVPPDAKSFDGVWGCSFDPVNRRLWIGDDSNDRFLVYQVE